jgi:hypothetical protein
MQRHTVILLARHSAKLISWQLNSTLSVLPCCLSWSAVCLQVRMPEGDSVVLDDADAPSSSSSSSRQKAGAAVQGDVIDAEFRDLK